MVFQHFSLFDALTVTENIALGIPPELAQGDLAERVRALSDSYGLPLDPSRRVGDLSVGERQRVEIVRALLQDPSLLIMDEPTSVLTPQEVEQLFKTLRRLRDEGRSILYISHKLDEVRQLCDRATILRGGMMVGECDPSQETATSLAEMMIGERLMTTHASERGEPGPVRLQLQSVDLTSESAFGVGLRAVSLEARAGQILGVAGVAGNGQEELLQAIVGERPVANGQIIFDGRDITHSSSSQRRELVCADAPKSA